MIAGYAAAGEVLKEPKYIDGRGEGGRLRPDDDADEGRPAAADLRRAARREAGGAG